MHRPLFLMFSFAACLALPGCMRVAERDAYAGLDLGTYQSGPSEVIFWTQGWWREYNDPALNALIARAFADSPNLNQMRARLVQAQASVRGARSGLFPTLSLSGERSKADGESDSTIDKGSDFSLSGAASFEIDLWGRNRANVRSARQEAEAQREEIYAAGITLAAEIVNVWLALLSLAKQERVVRKQIETNETVLSLQGRRFERGSAVALDVLQQEENLARSQALLPDILSAQRLAQNNLAVLVGLPPSASPPLPDRDIPHMVDIPPVGLPSDLLNDRPDVRAAWARVTSSDWAAYAAFADRLPRFSLSAAYSSNAGRIADLFENWLLNLVAGVSAPIVDGGARRAEMALQDARADEAFYAYQEVILQAVLDVENALVRNQFQDDKLTALRKQLNASYKTLEQSQFSYANGKSSYINVLSSLTSSQSLELQISQEALVQAQNRVSLHRALGGRSWAVKEVEDE